MKHIYILAIFIILILNGCSSKHEKLDLNNNSINIDKKISENTFYIKNKYIKYSENGEYPLFLINDKYIAGIALIFNNIAEEYTYGKFKFLDNKNGDITTINQNVTTCNNDNKIYGKVTFIQKDIYLYLKEVCIKLKLEQ